MKRNKFGLSYYRLLSGKQGQLLPVGITPILPGDTFRKSVACLARVAPLVHPVMHPCHMSFRTFFVPTRILWDNFADHFITGGTNGEGDGSVAPYITIPGGGFAVGSLADYLGVPTSQGAGVQISALPFRAYAAIYNEYFRDKQLQSPLALSKADGSDTTTNLILQNCDWEKDYFTTSRPEPQLGPDVTIALTGNAPVKGIGFQSVVNSTTNVTGLKETAGTGTTSFPFGATTYQSGMYVRSDGSGTDDRPLIYADMSALTGISINDLRDAFAQQTFQEHRSRFGDTYIEYLRYLGLQSSDARLQLPEYLGGYKTTIQFSEVLSQNGASGGNLGALGGHGIAAAKTGTIQRYFEEHGYLITVCYVRPKTIYMNGLPRHWSKTEKEQYWQREYEHTGQQTVENKEVYLGHTTPAGEFGYQDVYDEYRRNESGVSGEFRTTMKDWHFARDISSDGAATLDANFVKAVPRTDPYAATTADNMYLMVSHREKARRLVASTGWSSNV